ncbi:MAG: hypothetical protein HYY30_01475 [Chloroflexi bacterium]|nr:hypothetical protein [Chloroflexota bacterium]
MDAPFKRRRMTSLLHELHFSLAFSTPGIGSEGHPIVPLVARFLFA